MKKEVALAVVKNVYNTFDISGLKVACAVGALSALLTVVSFVCFLSIWNFVQNTTHVSVEVEQQAIELIEEVIEIKEVSVSDYVKIITERDNSNLQNTEYLTSTIIKFADKYDIPLIPAFALIYAESSFFIDATSRLGKDNGFGLTQVSKIGLADYNRINGTSYVQDDLLDIEVALEIGFWIYKQNGLYVPYLENDVEYYVAYNVGAFNFKKYYDSHWSNDLHPSGKSYTARMNYLSKRSQVAAAFHETPLAN
jgi:hypothetical protein